MTKAERYREWARNNREKLRANNRRYYQKNKKSISDKNAARARAAWPATRDVRYGLSSSQYNSMLEAQRGVCAVCGRPPKGKRRQRALCVDHDHRSGTVRGLLCYDCNLMLGHAKDDAEVLRRAADYLQAHGAAVPGTGTRDDV
jgi:hypothetical protein